MSPVSSESSTARQAGGISSRSSCSATSSTKLGARSDSPVRLIESLNASPTVSSRRQRASASSERVITRLSSSRPRSRFLTSVRNSSGPTMSPFRVRIRTSDSAPCSRTSPSVRTVTIGWYQTSMRLSLSAFSTFRAATDSMLRSW